MPPLDEAQLTPRRIVEYLDRYVVGQETAKRAVAVALRNRWRRRQLPDEMRREIMPKNIIMIGPTGVGKTEVARRLAQLVSAPFIKIEATKFTEVGYHGRDVDSMVRDLAQVAHNMVTAEERAKVREKAAEWAEERLLDALLPAPAAAEGDSRKRAREKVRSQLRSGLLDDHEVEIALTASAQPIANVLSAMGDPEAGFQLQDALSRMMPKQVQRRRLKVKDARSVLEEEAAGSILDEDYVARETIRRTEEDGIIFLDELDKIAATYERAHGPDVSREGVQRDLLPVVEGTVVATRYGPVRTDFILFIAAGTFSHASVQDLLPELQGRFPIRVELAALTEEDFQRILTAPETSLVRQYTALLSADGVGLEFSGDAVAAIARIASDANRAGQNIGARRLHTVMERLLEDFAFRAPDDLKGRLAVDAAVVRQRLSDIIEDPNLAKYIL